MSRKEKDVNSALQTLKKSFTGKYRLYPLYGSSSCCLYHILSYTDPNEVNKNSN